jgi:hypothetical protein
MLIIQDKLISDEIIERRFICNLDACKGACCWEGDYGAPLEDEELPVLDAIYSQIKPFLSPAGQAAIAAQGPYIYYEDNESYGTPLIDNGPCAYMVFDGNGVAKCGIEQAYQAGAVDFPKPISCHLYPIRVRKGPENSFEALNYDEWDICSAACTKGEKEQVPVYAFLKEAIIRRYGAEFYDELDAAAKNISK